jgi:hypothetical protein
MTKLESLQPSAAVRGILPDASVTVVNVHWHGSDALTLIYRGPSGRVAEEILYRSDEPRLRDLRRRATPAGNLVPRSEPKGDASGADVLGESDGHPRLLSWRPISRHGEIFTPLVRP